MIHLCLKIAKYTELDLADYLDQREGTDEGAIVNMAAMRGGCRRGYVLPPPRSTL